MRSKTKKRLHLFDSLAAGFGALVGLSLIGVIAQSVEAMMIIAPFGATAVLLFSAPQSPFSKPMNIFGGYVISTLLGAAVLEWTGGGWLSIGIGLGLTIALMQWANVIHPPAGANFLIVTQGHLTWYLLGPLFAGLIVLIVVGMGFYRIRQNIARE